MPFWRVIKDYWITWCCWSSLIFIGTMAYMISSTPVTAIVKLVPNTSIEISIFRLRSSRMGLWLDFQQNNNDPRPELGEYRARKHKDNSFDILEFPNPGVPIKLQVLIKESGASYIFEALPRTSHNSTSIGRQMVIFVDDGNSNTFIYKTVFRTT